MGSKPVYEVPFDAQSLRLLQAIADLGSMSAAAVALGYSQPAVSQQIARLEVRLGMGVVEKAGRSVRLTAAGRVLARHSSSVSHALDAAANELAELRGLSKAHVRLIGFPSASTSVVPRLLTELAVQHPGLTITYVEGEPAEAVSAVREDLADVALTFSYPRDRDDPHIKSDGGMDVRRLAIDTLLAVLPAGHPSLLHSTPLELSDLAGDAWIAGCPRCRGHLLESCKRSGFQPRIVFETDNIVAVEAMVARGLGVATLPKMAIDSFPLIPGVVVRTLPDSEARTINTVTARGAERNPAVRVVAASLSRILRPAA